LLELLQLQLLLWLHQQRLLHTCCLLWLLLKLRGLLWLLQRHGLWLHQGRLLTHRLLTQGQLGLRLLAEGLLASIGLLCRGLPPGARRVGSSWQVLPAECCQVDRQGGQAKGGQLKGRALLLLLLLGPAGKGLQGCRCCRCCCWRLLVLLLLLLWWW
jgi:hypothetical protein